MNGWMGCSAGDKQERMHKSRLRRKHYYYLYFAQMIILLMAVTKKEECQVDYEEDKEGTLGNNCFKWHSLAYPFSANWTVFSSSAYSMYVCSVCLALLSYPFFLSCCTNNRCLLFPRGDNSSRVQLLSLANRADEERPTQRTWIGSTAAAGAMLCPSGVASIYFTRTHYAAN